MSHNPSCGLRVPVIIKVFSLNTFIVFFLKQYCSYHHKIGQATQVRRFVNHGKYELLLRKMKE